MIVTSSSRPDDVPRDFNDGGKAVYDFTYWGTSPRAAIHTFLKGIAKKGVYQQEAGDEKQGIHYQGRISLFKKKTLAATIALFQAGPMIGAHISRTNTLSIHDFDYVSKTDGRVAGPWNLSDPEPEEEPREIQGIKLRPWQQSVIDSCHVVQERGVNVLIDVIGCRGKSVLKKYMRYHKHAAVGPPTSEKKNLMAFFIAKKAEAYVFDLPRDFQTKKSVGEFWSGIESIKDGYGFDPRYKHQECQRSSPVVWIFTNTKPDLSKLTGDRWHLWMIGVHDELLEWSLIAETRMQTVYDLRLKKKRAREPSVGVYNVLNDLEFDPNKYI